MQLNYSETELLATHQNLDPLFVGTKRCHGGFHQTTGSYVSPRVRFRSEAIANWRQNHERVFGTSILDLPISTWPENFPNLEQAKSLLRNGVFEPLFGTLTRIGTVEGFGANIALLRPTDLQRHFVEPIHGTGIDHLGRGLFEAHGRDEAGFEEQAGHKDMWFYARDIAFEGRDAKVDIDAMLVRMGLVSAEGGPPIEPQRLLPDSIDPTLEFMVTLMIRVLLIEIQAFHTFNWAEAWLGDESLVAGEGEPAKLIDYIRQDEAPHVGYLSTVLTEMRDRTWIDANGRRHEGQQMLGTLWEAGLERSLGEGRQQTRAVISEEIRHWIEKAGNSSQITEEFNSLGEPLCS